jgi:hypothetical protein
MNQRRYVVLKRGKEEEKGRAKRNRNDKVR